MTENDKHELTDAEMQQASGGGSLKSLGAPRRLSGRRNGADTGSGSQLHLDPLGDHDEASPQRRRQMDPLNAPLRHR